MRSQVGDGAQESAPFFLCGRSARCARVAERAGRRSLRDEGAPHRMSVRH